MCYGVREIKCTPYFSSGSRISRIQNKTENTRCFHIITAFPEQLSRVEHVRGTTLFQTPTPVFGFITTRTRINAPRGIVDNCRFIRYDFFTSTYFQISPYISVFSIVKHENRICSIVIFSLLPSFKFLSSGSTFTNHTSKLFITLRKSPSGPPHIFRTCVDDKWT